MNIREKFARLLSPLLDVGRNGTRPTTVMFSRG